MFSLQKSFFTPVVAIVFLLCAISCIPFSAAIAAPQLRHAQQTFAKNFYVPDNVSMRGITKTYQVNFSRPRTWDVKQGTSLLLKFSHSTALLPDISLITVSLNGTQLKSTRLVASNAQNGSVRILLPPDQIGNFNVLSITVEQHYTKECEYPFNTALWTIISKESSINWVYLQRPISLDLVNYESTFNDDSAATPQEVAFLYAANVSSETLTAISQISGSLAQLTPFKQFSSEMVKSLSKANLPTMIVGTLQEQPIIAVLAKHPIPEQGGVLELIKNPSHPQQPILLVTGRSSVDVMLAARALVQRTARRALNGSYMIISRIEPRQIPLPQSNSHLLPDSARFTLADIGIKDKTVRGYYGGAIISFPFSPPPNAKYYNGKTTMDLHFAYSAGLDEKKSSIEIRSGNTAVSSIPLKAGGSDPVHQTVSIAAYLLQPESNLSIVFHLLPKDTDYCKRVVDDQVWGTVFSDTSFYFPHDKITNLPDLVPLATGGYPFTRDQGLSKTVFVLPKSPQPVDQNVMLAVINRIALFSNETAISPLAIKVSELTSDQRQDNNLIVIGSSQKQPLLQSIVNESEYREYYSAPKQQNSTRDSQGQIIQNSVVEPLQDFLIARNPYLNASDFKSRGVLEETLSPWNSDRVILILTGRDDNLLARNIDVFSNLNRFSNLEGNLALLEKGGAYRTFHTSGSDNNIRDISYTRKVVIWLGDHLVWILAFVVFVLILILSAFFRPRLAKSKME